MARHECLISLFVAVPSSSFSTTNPGEEAVVSQPHLSSVFLYMPTLLVLDKLTVCGLNTYALILFNLGKLGGRMS